MRICPLLAALGQRSRQFARRKPVVEPGRTSPRLFELDGEVDRPLLAGPSRRPSVTGQARLNRRLATLLCRSTLPEIDDGYPSPTVIRLHCCSGSRSVGVGALSQLKCARKSLVNVGAGR
ncbi:hypothetical protein D9M68_100540 [compost metagenome]